MLTVSRGTSPTARETGGFSTRADVECEKKGIVLTAEGVVIGYKVSIIGVKCIVYV